LIVTSCDSKKAALGLPFFTISHNESMKPRSLKQAL